jgi:DNA-binding transcriptional LysR family regulator
VGCLLMARMPTTPPSAARDQPVAQLPISGSSLAIIPASTSAGLLSDAAFAGEGIPRRIACEVGDWELFLELVSAGVGIGFAPVGLQYPVLTAADSVLRLIAVADVHLERHIHLILPSPGETSPAAQRFADQLLRIHAGGN